MSAPPSLVGSRDLGLRYRHAGPEEKPIRRPRRNRRIWPGLIAAAIALGLGSRRFGGSLPGFVADYAGDTLWALVAFLGLGFALPAASTRAVALLALAFATAIEVSQLYHAPWIDSLRGRTLGALVLGQGFLASDLACYAVGVGIGTLLECCLRDNEISGGNRPGPGGRPGGTRDAPTAG